MITHNGRRTIAWCAPQHGTGAPLPAPDPLATLFPGEQVVRMDDIDLEVDGVRKTVAVYETLPEQASAGA